MEIGKHYPGIDSCRCMKKIVMIAPINSDIQETQNIADEFWNQCSQIVPLIAVRHFDLKYHYGDNDCHDTVAESFKPASLHASLILIFELMLSLCQLN
jgi:hypothetical protein